MGIKHVKPLFILIVVLMLSITACTNNTTNEIPTNTEKVSGEQEIDNEKVALSFIEDLTNGKFENAYNNYNFNSQMKDAISPIYLKEAMDQLNKSIGSFKKIIKTQASTKDGYDIITNTCEFEKDFINLNVVFDQDKAIAGFNFTKPSESDIEGNNSKENLPDSIEEKEVTVGKGNWQLPGTLTIPKGEGPFPAIVLVHGSGPNDRDETIGFNKPFRDIAWGLASEGIAVLRYDKRTKVHLDKMLPIMNEITVKEEVMDDALNAVELLRENKDIDKNQIYLLGHSLGGYLVPRIGVQDQDIAGFVVLAGSTRPLEDIIVEQYEYLAKLDGTVSDDEEKQIEAVKKARQKIKSSGLEVDTDPNELMGLNAKYWLDLRAYDPLKVVKDLNRPLLILQGERDYQVTMVDYNNWNTVLKNDDKSTFKTFEKLNHLFMAGEGQPNPNEYNEKGKVSQDVIDTIQQWIKNK